MKTMTKQSTAKKVILATAANHFLLSVLSLLQSVTGILRFLADSPITPVYVHSGAWIA